MQKLSLNRDKREFILESGKSDCGPGDTFILVVRQVLEGFINRTKKVVKSTQFQVQLAETSGRGVPDDLGTSLL